MSGRGPVTAGPRPRREPAETSDDQPREGASNDTFFSCYFWDVTVDDGCGQR